MARTLSQKIDQLAHQCRGRRQLKVQELFHLMDYAEASLVTWILYIPFILLYEIPGFAFVVSLLVVLQGVGIALHKKLWIPKFLGDKKISGDHFAHFISYTIRFLKKLEKIAHPRGTIYQHHPLLITFNGWVMAMGGVFLILHHFHIGTAVIPSIGLFLLAIGLLEEDILWMFCAYGVLAIQAAHVITLLLYR
jgi:hypothetical protein